MVALMEWLRRLLHNPKKEKAQATLWDDLRRRVFYALETNQDVVYVTMDEYLELLEMEFAADPAGKYPHDSEWTLMGLPVKIKGKIKC